MKAWASSSVVAFMVATSVSGDSACTPGAYRCGSTSGQGTTFYQCDAGSMEVQKSCAPGTVCYTQGSTILCGFPVNTANQLSPASSSLTVGAQCSFVSPYDEYMCPGASGQYDYFLRCLSGTYVHFSCPPGTACVKNEGQNMYCGFKSQPADVIAANATSVAPTPSSASAVSTSTSELALSSTLDSLSLATTSSPFGASSASTALESPTDSSSSMSGSTTASLSESATSISSSDAVTDFPPLFPPTSASNTDSFTSADSSSSDLLSDLFPSTSSASTTGASVTSTTEASISSATEGSASASTTEASVTSSLEVSAISTTEAAATSTTAESASSTTSEASSVEISTGATIGAQTSSKFSANSASPAPTAPPALGLTGPIISSGLEMLLNNGVHLPFSLPDINIPAIDLGTVHLPDMTFSGIAITAISLPSITIPPFDPASLTHFTYIQSLMSQAGITFDDLAKLPIPDLSHIDLSNLGNVDPAVLMSLIHVNRVSVPTEAVSSPLTDAAPSLQTSPHTTTLDANGIEGLIGLSIMTYGTPK